MAHIILKNIKKSYGKVDVIKGIDLEINDQEFVAFVGPSGCGKSTLLRIISGLETPSSGEVFIDNKDVTNDAPADRKIAMVFQSYALYPQMTVKENMSFALSIAKESKAIIEEKVQYAGKMLKLDHLFERLPKELSGGQRQRVAIGRAIVRNPKLFLFDEPLSNLDAELRVDMRIQIAELHRSLQSSMVYVTHDQVEAMTLADKIVVLRDGIIEQTGTPQELYEHPKNKFVAGFLGSPKMNFIPVKVQTANSQSVIVNIDETYQVTLPKSGEHLSPGDDLLLGIRPEHLYLQNTIGQDSNKLNMTINVTEYLGSSAYIHCTSSAIEKLTLIISAENMLNKSLTASQDIDIFFHNQYCHLFDKNHQALLTVEN
ncbi:MAG TPA: ABC transporter [Vibrio sp.]|uniref:ABC transporter ATP-binding protein n=1 Tax=Vibrio sp. TaxID=678 RepID=UPI000EBB2A54|nr:sn-glycerol-3-phosphate ABC transporter ATP-binding protein UgpC [Vibrio sp.]HCH02996.1 ABC transporter [Vibrio sp.]